MVSPSLFLLVLGLLLTDISYTWSIRRTTGEAA